MDNSDNNNGYDNNGYENNDFGSDNGDMYSDSSTVDSFGSPIQDMGGFNAPQNQGTPVLAIVSMILGILAAVFSVVCCCAYGYFLGAPLGIAALITGFISMKKQADGKGMAIAGIITGAVGLLAGIVIIVMVAVGVGATMMENMSF